MKIDQEIYHGNENEITCHTKQSDFRAYGFHWHEKYEMCQILSKSCSFLADGILINASAGDIVLFKERSIHCFIIDRDVVNIRVLQFPIKTLLNAGIPIKTLPAHIPLKDMESISGLSQKINTLFEFIAEECHGSQRNDTPFLNSLTASLYSLLTQYFSEEDDKNTTTKDQRIFYKIVEYVNSHFLEDININTLSETLLISRGKLSSIFTKYSGTSLNEYLNSLRIQNANELINHGYSITQAALESGFQSIRTFNNVYKKITGTTPSDYAGKK